MSRPERLPDHAVSDMLRDLPSWEIAPDRIRRSFTFDNFAIAFGFMAELAVVAEKMDHHPEWSNVWNRVDVELTTHDAGGITELDIRLATSMDAAAKRRTRD